MNNESFYTIHGWMINELNLKGNDLLTYAVIYSFSQGTGECINISLNAIRGYLNASKDTALRSIQFLENRGLIGKLSGKNSNSISNGYYAIPLDEVSTDKKEVGSSKMLVAKCYQSQNASSKMLPHIYTVDVNNNNNNSNNNYYNNNINNNISNNIEKKEKKNETKKYFQENNKTLTIEGAEKEQENTNSFISHLERYSVDECGREIFRRQNEFSANFEALMMIHGIKHRLIIYYLFYGVPYGFNFHIYEYCKDEPQTLRDYLRYFTNWIKTLKARNEYTQILQKATNDYNEYVRKKQASNSTTQQ